MIKEIKKKNVIDTVLQLLQATYNCGPTDSKQLTSVIAIKFQQLLKLTAKKKIS